MFYCDDCGRKNKWPIGTLSRSQGPCEICHKIPSSPCNDVPSSLLPPAPKQTGIIDTFWFTMRNGQVVGIVVMQPEFGPRKAYMGLGHGVSQEVDQRNIVEWGFPVTLTVLRDILNSLEVL
jgi:hypothetical protein